MDRSGWTGSPASQNHWHTRPPQGHHSGMVSLLGAVLLIANIGVVVAVLTLLGSLLNPRLSPLEASDVRVAVQWGRSTGLRIPRKPSPVLFFAAAICLALFFDGAAPSALRVGHLLWGVPALLLSGLWFKQSGARNQGVHQLHGKWIDAGRPDPLPPAD